MDSLGFLDVHYKNKIPKRLMLVEWMKPMQSYFGQTTQVQESAETRDLRRRGTRRRHPSIRLLQLSLACGHRTGCRVRD